MRHDLAADLKAIRAGATVFPDPDPGVRTEYELHEVAEHAIERALKAEALAWELVAALRRISEILDSATCRCRCGFCEYFNAQKRADKALAKAKEVLGDEAT